MPEYKVELTYFKPSGKYYSTGEYTSTKDHLFQILEEVEAMFAEHKRPGLVDGPQSFITLVNVPGHPHDHPNLIMPERERKD